MVVIYDIVIACYDLFWICSQSVRTPRDVAGAALESHEACQYYVVNVCIGYVWTMISVGIAALRLVAISNQFTNIMS